MLWQRVLQHPNLVVQRQGLRTFLQRDWGYSNSGSVVQPDSAEGGDAAAATETSSRGEATPADRTVAATPFPPLRFVEAVLLPALLQRDVHFRPAADAREGFDTQAVVARWLAAWIAAAPPAEQRGLIEAFAMQVPMLCVGGVSARITMHATSPHRDVLLLAYFLMQCSPGAAVLSPPHRDVLLLSLSCLHHAGGGGALEHSTPPVPDCGLGGHGGRGADSGTAAATQR